MRLPIIKMEWRPYNRGLRTLLLQNILFPPIWNKLLGSTIIGVREQYGTLEHQVLWCCSIVISFIISDVFAWTNPLHIQYMVSDEL